MFAAKDGQKIVIQCKAHKAPVGPGVVRDLYGTLINEKADKALLASVSGFTKGVFEFIEGKPIELIGLNQIIQLSTRE
ncbi:MAG: restriction endonuclease [Candidatus Brocadiales bacterium]